MSEFCENPITPIFPGDYPDPTVYRDGEDFYFTFTPNMYSPGLVVWHSKNLVDWEPISIAVPDSEEEYSNIWAPEILKHNDLWYIYFPAKGNNYVVTAKTPYGPWSKPVCLNVGHIDPGHIVDVETGERYMHLSGGNVIKLSDDGLSTVGEVQHVYDGWKYPDEWHTEGMCLESPKLFYKDGYYYLSVAEGGTAGPATSHMLAAARSKSPIGPWENSPYNPIIHTYHKDEKWVSKGHGTVFEDGKGNWYVMYHAYENGYATLGRHILLEPIVWTEDGWFKIDETKKLPAREKTSFDFHSFSDSFDGDKLDMRWAFYEGRSKESYALTNNGLVMKGVGSDICESHFMTMITSAHSYETQLEVSVEGDAVGGIALAFGTKKINGICYDGNNVGFQFEHRHINAHPVGKNKVYLKLINDEHLLSMYYSLDKSEWKKLEVSYDTANYVHNVLGDFLSLRIALFAYGNGNVTFSNFRYEKRSEK